MMRTRNQAKYRYNCVPHGHVLIPLRVPLQIFQHVNIQEFVAPYSYNRPSQIVSLVIRLLLII